MIDATYVRHKARYNSWENKQLKRSLEAMSVDELLLDRGAFFGSIFGTINHLLWGDMLWLSRFDPSASAPKGTIAESKMGFPTLGAWSAQRFRTDGHISLWSEHLKSVDLQGDLSWFSGSANASMTKPIALCIMHFFNHQTHHRGQVHAMITAAGYDAPVSDLILLPDEI